MEISLSEGEKEAEEKARISERERNPGRVKTFREKVEEEQEKNRQEEDNEKKRMMRRRRRAVKMTMSIVVVGSS